jgi:hypothetical protein
VRRRRPTRPPARHSGVKYCCLLVTAAPPRSPPSGSHSVHAFAAHSSSGRGGPWLPPEGKPIAGSWMAGWMHGVRRRRDVSCHNHSPRAGGWLLRPAPAPRIRRRRLASFARRKLVAARRSCGAMMIIPHPNPTRRGGRRREGMLRPLTSPGRTAPARRRSVQQVSCWTPVMIVRSASYSSAQSCFFFLRARGDTFAGF